MSGPIRPSDVAKKKTADIPEEVFDAFNELITANWGGCSATILQDDATKLALKKLKASGKHITRDQLFDKGYMDIEDSYRAKGWRVEYDTPGYCEDYKAFFKFEPR